LLQAITSLKRTLTEFENTSGVFRVTPVITARKIIKTLST